MLPIIKPTSIKVVLNYQFAIIKVTNNSLYLVESNQILQRDRKFALIKKYINIKT